MSDASPNQFTLPATLPVEDLLAALQARCGLAGTGRTRHRHQYLDTWDWRLYRKGRLLAAEPAPDGLRLSLCPNDAGAPCLHQLTTDLPRYASDLGPTALGRAVQALARIRALLPRLSVDATVHRFERRDAEGKLLVSVSVEERTIQPAGGGRGHRPPVRVRLGALRGYEAAADRVRDCLTGTLALPPLARTLDAETLAALGLDPGLHPPGGPVRLDPAMAAHTAVRRVLAGQLAVLRFNEPGVREDIDSECLHDFRIGVRRSRSVLALMKRHLPRRTGRHLRTELAWLGSVTSPLRDLDVHLLSFSGYTGLLPPGQATHLAALQHYLQHRRRAAWQELRAHLDSPRYARLLQAWAAFAEASAPPDLPEAADEPVGPAAGRRIWQLYRLARREGLAITEASPDTDLHELRKTCKKLRYMLELFASLFAAGQVARLRRPLKSLQDNLGEFQDLCVHAQALAEFAEDMHRERRADAATLLAMGALIQALEARKREVRAGFQHQFRAFAARRFRRAFRELAG